MIDSAALSPIGSIFQNTDLLSIAPAQTMTQLLSMREINGTANILSNHALVVIDAAFGKLHRRVALPIAYCNHV